MLTRIALGLNLFAAIITAMADCWILCGLNIGCVIFHICRL